MEKFVKLEDGKYMKLGEVIKNWKTGETKENVLRDTIGRIILFDKQHQIVGRY